MQNINAAMDWISRNQHLFELSPQLLSILTMETSERERTLRKLQQFHVDYEEKLEETISFIFFTRHNFLLFIEEMDGETWNVNCTCTNK